MNESKNEKEYVEKLEKIKMYALGTNDLDLWAVKESATLSIQVERVADGKPLAMNRFMQVNMTPLDKDAICWLKVWSLMDGHRNPLYVLPEEVWKSREEAIYFKVKYIFIK